MYSISSPPKRKSLARLLLHPFSFSNISVDPVIEPMLQSIPDPFDSYGPPQAEDQIFSILQPLSISANAPSRSPTPMKASPPQTPKPDDNTISRNVWSPHNGEYFSTSEAGPHWSDLSSPSSTPPTSSTPPRSVSPPASTVKRRQSHPPSSAQQPRKATSKLKSVLPAVEESIPQHANSSGVADMEPIPSLSALNGDTPIPDTSWGPFPYGESPYEAFDGSGETTPQHSRHPSLYSQPPILAFDPDSPRNQTQPDYIAHVPLPT
jgi:hypothetical protein